MLIHSMNANSSGNAEKVTTQTASTASAKSGGYTGGSAIVTVTEPTFIRVGLAPTALNTGVDQFLLGNAMYRITGIPSGAQLAFIKPSGASDGIAYITPEGE